MNISASEIGAVIGVCLFVLAVGLGIYIASLSDLRIQRVAKKLGLKDKGFVRSYFKKDDDGIIRKMVLLHTLCRSRVRVGINLSTGDPVQWCHVCECVNDNENGGDSGDSGNNHPNNPVSPEVAEYTRNLIEKIRH
jgi:hypothetical protein